MKCGCCGKEIGEFAFDKSYRMPDEIWDLPQEEREARAQTSDDFCRLDNRYFIRGVVHVPVNGTDRDFGWGIWAEVQKEKFLQYFENFDKDNSFSLPFQGEAANSLPHHPETLGIGLRVKLGNQTQRPAFEIIDDAHLLAFEQKQGISLVRVHELNGK